jgi:hypothetical protein
MYATLKSQFRQWCNMEEVFVDEMCGKWRSVGRCKHAGTPVGDFSRWIEFCACCPTHRVLLAEITMTRSTSTHLKKKPKKKFPECAATSFLTAIH